MKTTQYQPAAAETLCGDSFWHLRILDNPVRRYLQNPEKILKGRVNRGMTALDIGCGPGVFTRTLASMVGEEGTVIAVDLQDGMLRHARKRSADHPYGSRITWHQCRPDTLQLSTPVDFALSMYMVHEVPDRERLFSEVYGLLRPGGRYLVVEPVFHVTRESFIETEEIAVRAGFHVAERPAFSLSRSILLER